MVVRDPGCPVFTALRNVSASLPRPDFLRIVVGFLPRRFTMPNRLVHQAAATGLTLPQARALPACNAQWWCWQP